MPRTACPTLNRPTTKPNDSLRRRRWPMARLAGFASLAVALCQPSAASAAEAPIVVQGALRTAGGGPVADGSYGLTLKLYAAADAADALWGEAATAVAVAQGLFVHVLGSSDLATAPAQALFVDHPGLWIGVRVGSDPELPRLPLGAVPYARRALHADVAAHAGTTDKALDLDCVGCVGANHVSFTWAASNQKDGAAVDLACSGCVGSGEIASGAVTVDHLGAGSVGGDALAVNYAGSDSKGGTATTAKVALTAEELNCSGCIGQVHLEAGLLAKLLAPATTVALGGVIVGAHLDVDLKGTLGVQGADFLASSGGKLGGDLDLDSNKLLGVRLEDVEKLPACDAASAGRLVFVPGQKRFYGCTGESWEPLNTGAVGSEGNPALSCKALLAAGGGKGSGAYWIKPGAEEVQVWCDMETGGGGWTWIAVVNSDTDNAGKTRVLGVTAFGSVGNALETSEYSVDASGLTFTEVMIPNGKSGDKLTHAAAGQLVWDTKTYKGGGGDVAKLVQLADALQLRTGYYAGNNTNIPVCFSKNAISSSWVCDSDSTPIEGWIDASGGEFCGATGKPRKWAKGGACTVYGGGDKIVYGLAVR